MKMKTDVMKKELYFSCADVEVLLCCVQKFSFILCVPSSYERHVGSCLPDPCRLTGEIVNAFLIHPPRNLTKSFIRWF